MQGYLNKGQFKSIPVFVFFDDAFRELGHWIERPASVTEVRAKRRKEIFAAHPEFGSPDAPVDQLAEDFACGSRPSSRRCATTRQSSPTPRWYES